MSEKNTNTVLFRPDVSNPPSLTPEQAERLERMKDSDIDLADTPPLAEGTAWKRRYPETLRKAS